jgi:hypothetical protein
MSDYRLDDRAIEVRSPAEAKVGPFLGVNRGRGVTLTTRPHVVPKSRMSRSEISFPPYLLHGE